MQTAAQAAEKALQNAPSDSPEKATSASAGKLRNAAMRKLWSRMAAIYGHRWSSSFGERCEDDDGMLTTAGDTWQRGLAGVDERQVAAGLQAALVAADPWPPTLPAFRAMCLDVPTLASVKLRMQHETDDPFTRLVWQHLDSYRLRQVDADKADRMIRDAYELAREHVMAGGELPDIAGHLDAPEPEARTPASPETAESNLRQMAEKLGVSPEVSS